MSTTVLILVVLFILFLIGLGVVLYFVFRKNNETSGPTGTTGANPFRPLIPSAFRSLGPRIIDPNCNPPVLNLETAVQSRNSPDPIDLIFEFVEPRENIHSYRIQLSNDGFRTIAYQTNVSGSDPKITRGPTYFITLAGNEMTPVYISLQSGLSARIIVEEVCGEGVPSNSVTLDIL